MNKKNNDKENIDFFNEIKEASENNKLIFFIGSGVSNDLGFPSWNEYIHNFIDYWEGIVNKDTDDNMYAEKFLIIKNSANKSSHDKTIFDRVYSIIKNRYGDNFFREHRLDYEKRIFKTTYENVKTNSVLYQLCKFNAAYLTLNYDDAIETYLEKTKGIKVTNLDIKEFIDNDFNFSINSIVHVHGSILGNQEFFLNSAESYNNLYKKNKIFKDGFGSFLSKIDGMIVFIGMGMSEKQVLEMLNFNDGPCKKVALLSGNDRNVVENLKDYGINYVEYGESHTELSFFLNNLICDLRKCNAIKNNKNYYNFSDDNLTDEQVFEILYEERNNLSGLFLNGLLSEDIKEKRIKQLIKSTSFINGTVYISRDLWSLVNTIKSYDEDETNNIVTHLINNDQSFYMDEAYAVFSKLNVNQNNIDDLYEKQSMLMAVEETAFYKNDILCCSWNLVNTIVNSDYDFECGNYDNFYDFDDRMQERLVSKFDKFTSNYESALLSTGLKVIYDLMFDDRLLLNGMDWNKSCNSIMLNTEIFKKISMNVKSDKTKKFFSYHYDIFQVSIIRKEQLMCSGNFHLLRLSEKIFYKNNKYFQYNYQLTSYTILNFLKDSNNSEEKKNILVSFFIENYRYLFYNYIYLYNQIFYLDYIDYSTKKNLSALIENAYCNHEGKRGFSIVDANIWKEIIRYSDDVEESMHKFLSINILTDDNEITYFEYSSIKNYIDVLKNDFKCSPQQIGEFINGLNEDIIDFLMGYYLPSFQYSPSDLTKYLDGNLKANFYSFDLENLKNLPDEEILSLYYKHGEVIDFSSIIFGHLRPNDLKIQEVKNKEKILHMLMKSKTDYKYSFEWFEYIISSGIEFAMNYIEYIFYLENDFLYVWEKYRCLFMEVAISYDKGTIPVLYTDISLQKLDGTRKNKFFSIYVFLLEKRLLKSVVPETYDYVFLNCSSDMMKKLEQYSKYYITEPHHQKNLTNKEQLINKPI